jgi:hypothetical protein
MREQPFAMRRQLKRRGVALDQLDAQLGFKRFDAQRNRRGRGVHGSGGRSKTAQTSERQKRFDKTGIHCISSPHSIPEGLRSSPENRHDAVKFNLTKRKNNSLAGYFWRY